MQRLFGRKQKVPKAAQSNPIPTPFPAEELHARVAQPYLHQPRTPQEESWTLIHDDPSPLINLDRVIPQGPVPTPRLEPPSSGDDSYFYHQQQSFTNHPRTNLSPPNASSNHKPIKKTPAAQAASAIIRSLEPAINLTKSRSSSPDSQPPNDIDKRPRHVTAEREVEPDRFRYRERDRDFELEREREIAKQRELQRTRELQWEKEMEREKEAMAQRQREMERENEREKDRERERTREPPSDRPREKQRDKESKKRGLFYKDKDKDKDRPKESRSTSGEITEMIGYLTATASENWSLVLEVCDRASSNENQAREAARALRREFKYAGPSAQLSAARLWAIMLQNCSDSFITYSSSKKFLDALEEVLTSPSTSPVVRERLMDVLAAAAFKHPGSLKEGYRALWKRLKPNDKPDEGIPFNEDDAMLNPAPAPITRPPPSGINNQVIPLHEDMRRLFEECEIARGNAQLLTQALTFARPEELNGTVISEWYRKCRNSQNFMMEQIPWATAQADQSKGELQRIRQANMENGFADTGPVPTSKEEELLAALLGANQELLEAFRIYDDLERLGRAEQEEREAEERSKKETRMDRTQIQYIAEDGSFHMETSSRSNHVPSGTAGPSRSPSPVPTSGPAPPLPPLPTTHSTSQLQSHHSASTLAPPSRPSGPRARTPSPDRPPALSVPASLISHIPGTGSGHIPSGSLGIDFNKLAELTFEDKRSRRGSSGTESGLITPIVPSAKAMGKRKAGPGVEDVDEQSEDFSHLNGRLSDTESVHESESLEDQPIWRRQPVKYVYDAAADRAKELRRDLGIPSPTTNGFGLPIRP